jgi:hypothetical protein
VAIQCGVRGRVTVLSFQVDKACIEPPGGKRRCKRLEIDQL